MDCYVLKKSFCKPQFFFLNKTLFQGNSKYAKYKSGKPEAQTFGRLQVKMICSVIS